MGKHRFLAVFSVLLALSAGVLVACGDSDEDAGAASSEPQVSPQIEKAVNDGLVNPRYEVDAVKVTQVEVDGDKATVETALTGGTLDGQAVAVALVKDKGKWQLDEVTSFVDLDRPLLEKEFAAELKSPSEGLSPAQISCLKEQFAKASQQLVESMYLDNASKAFVELGKPCKNA